MSVWLLELVNFDLCVREKITVMQFAAGIMNEGTSEIYRASGSLEFTEAGWKEFGHISRVRKTVYLKVEALKGT